MKSADITRCNQVVRADLEREVRAGSPNFTFRDEVETLADEMVHIHRGGAVGRTRCCYIEGR